MAAEAVKSSSRKVSCDGGKGQLGHPNVYLNMGEKDNIECPYCGKQFVLDNHAAHHADDAH